MYLEYFIYVYHRNYQQMFISSFRGTILYFIFLEKRRHWENLFLTLYLVCHLQFKRLTVSDDWQVAKSGNCEKIKSKFHQNCFALLKIIMTFSESPFWENSVFMNIWGRLYQFFFSPKSVQPNYMYKNCTRIFMINFSALSSTPARLKMQLIRVVK